MTSHAATADAQMTLAKKGKNGSTYVVIGHSKVLQITQILDFFRNEGQVVIAQIQIM